MERDRQAGDPPVELPGTAAGRAVASLLAGASAAGVAREVALGATAVAGPDAVASAAAAAVEPVADRIAPTAGAASSASAAPATAAQPAVAVADVAPPPASSAAASAAPVAPAADARRRGAAPKPAWERPGVRTGLRERIVYPLRQLLIFGSNRVVFQLPGHALRLAYLRHALGWRIAPTANVHYGLQLYGGRGGVTIGERSTIQIGCLFAGVGMSQLTIGDDVAIAYRTTIILGGHDVHSPDFEMVLGPVVIENHVFVGANATILGGVTLGEGCVVGAGAVVGKSVPPYAIVIGNPAKVVGERRRDLRYSAQHRWPFH